MITSNGQGLPSEPISLGISIMNCIIIIIIIATIAEA